MITRDTKTQYVDKLGVTLLLTMLLRDLVAWTTNILHNLLKLLHGLIASLPPVSKLLAKHYICLHGDIHAGRQSLHQF